MIIIVFQVPLGIATAVSVRVGNELGAGQPLRAKRSAYVSIAMTCELMKSSMFHCITVIIIFLCICVVTAAVLIAVFIQSTKTVIGKLFTSDE